MRRLLASLLRLAAAKLDPEPDKPDEKVRGICLEPVDMDTVMRNTVVGFSDFPNYSGDHETYGVYL